MDLIESLSGKNYITQNGIEPDIKKSIKCFNVIKEFIKKYYIINISLNNSYDNKLLEAIDQLEITIFHKYSNQSMVILNII